MEYLKANLHEDDVTDPRVNAIIHRVLQAVDQTGTFDVAAALQSTDDEELQTIMMDTVMNRYELSKSWETMEKRIEREDPMKVAHDAVFALRNSTLKRAIDQNQQAMKSAARDGKESAEYLRAHQELMMRLKELEGTGSKA